MIPQFVAPTTFLVVSLCLTSALLSSIFWIAWRSFGREEHARTWALAFGVATAQWALNFSSSVIPDQRLYWIVVNGLGIAVVTLGLIGHWQRTRRPWRKRWLVAAGIAVELILAWFTVVDPHVGLRMALQPAYAGLLLISMGVIIYHSRPRPLPAERGAAAVHVAFGTIEMIAAFVALSQGVEREPRAFDLYLKINFLAMPAAYVGIGLFIVFILASDLAERARQLAVTDSLTGALNRRGFEEAAQRVLAQARRGRNPVALVLGDLDHFKIVNDRWGHAVGDRALLSFVEQARRERRVDDLVVRIGGEEFALLLPNSDRDEAVTVAERIRSHLAENPLQHGAERISLTASFGVAGSDGAYDLDALLHAADQALYRAKQGGRDRVEAAG